MLSFEALSLGRNRYSVIVFDTETGKNVAKRLIRARTNATLISQAKRFVRRTLKENHK